LKEVKGMLIIGEKINTSLEGVEEAVKTRNATFIHVLAKKLVKTLTKTGIPLEDIYIGPVVHSISTSSKSGLAVLEAIKRITDSFKGIHTICGSE
jgi:cobalamin-dependent methionine synthase I